MINNEKQEDYLALFRHKVISPLLDEHYEWGGLKKRIRKQAEKFHVHPVKGMITVSYKTIEEWYYKYKKLGYEGLKSSRRKDRNIYRCLSPELGQLILSMKFEKPQRTAKMIMKELILSKKIIIGEISCSTISRLLKQHRFELKTAGIDSIEKRKFEFMFSNECWLGDVCHGPHLKIEGFQDKKRIFLFAFIDDASRIIPHGEFFLAENMENFMEFFKTSILKKGIPERLYLDNAGYFKNSVVLKTGSRLGIKILYTTPYSPWKKGKIERFFRTVRKQFFIHLDKTKTYKLEELNEHLSRWIEMDYHHNIHSGISASPIKTWAKKAQNIKYPNAENLDFEFLAEEIRQVRKDGTIQLNSVHYKVDSNLAGQKIAVRFNPFKKGKIYVYINDEIYCESSPVNAVENTFIKRTKGRFPENKFNPSNINYLELLKSGGDGDV